MLLIDIHKTDLVPFAISHPSSRLNRYNFRHNPRQRQQLPDVLQRRALPLPHLFLQFLHQILIHLSPFILAIRGQCGMYERREHVDYRRKQLAVGVEIYETVRHQLDEQQRPVRGGGGATLERLEDPAH